MDSLALGIAFLATMASMASVILSYIAWRTAEQVAAVEVFLELRKAHDEIQSRMDPAYHDQNWDPTLDPDRRRMKTLERYWLHTFSEWYCTTKLNGGKFANIWDEFYKRAIVGGMRNKPLTKTLCAMDSSFCGYRREFLDSMCSIYRNAYHEELQIAPLTRAPATDNYETLLRTR